MEIPELDLKSVGYHLGGIANRDTGFPWKPPDPRQARRFAERLKALTAEMERMNLYYGKGLDPRFKVLPQVLIDYSQRLGTAARNRKKIRPPNDFIEREIAILRLLDRSAPGKEKHHYEQAADLIQAAYHVAKLKRCVDAEQLRKLYDRQSLEYRLKSEIEIPPSEAEKA